MMMVLQVISASGGDDVEGTIMKEGGFIFSVSIFAAKVFNLGQRDLRTLVTRIRTQQPMSETSIA